MHTSPPGSSKQETPLEETPPNSARKSRLKILTAVWDVEIARSNRVTRTIGPLKSRILEGFSLSITAQEYMKPILYQKILFVEKYPV